MGLLLLALGVYIIHERSAFEYKVTFKDAQGLQPGDPVTLTGVQVGTVRKVAHDKALDRVVVTLRIDADKKHLVSAPPDSSARILKDGWVFSKRRVEVVNRGKGESTMLAGVTVDGLESWSAEQLFRGKAMAEEGVEGAKKGIAAASEGLDQVMTAAREKIEAAKAYAKGPEAERLKARIEEVRTGIEQKSLEGAEKAKEKLSKAIEEGKKLTGELREKGQDDLAGDVEGTFIEWKQRAADFLDKGRRIAEEEDAQTSATATAP